MTPLYQINVRRDAYTTTPVAVPSYEVPILKAIFGEENVLNANNKLVADGFGDAVGEFSPSEDEFSRLAQRYGGNDKGAYVEQVYGLKASGKLDEAVAAASKPSKQGK